MSAVGYKRRLLSDVFFVRGRNAMQRNLVRPLAVAGGLFTLGPCFSVGAQYDADNTVVPVLWRSRV